MPRLLYERRKTMDSNNMNGANVNQQVSYQVPQGTPQYQQAPQGAPQPQYRQVQYQQPQYQQVQYQQPMPNSVPPVINNIQIPENYKPISAWGYVGYTILFCIPLLGLIMLIVFSFSDANINRRNYARSYWCVLLLAILIGLALFVLAMVFGFSLIAAFR